MADYGRTLEFGAGVAPLVDPPDFAARVAVAADRAGLDLVGIQDHPYQRRFLDTWTLISTLVPLTERIRFFLDVACLPCVLPPCSRRPPRASTCSPAAAWRWASARGHSGTPSRRWVDHVEALGRPSALSKKLHR
jgi:hypothetical protein